MAVFIDYKAEIKEVNMSTLNTAGNIKVNVSSISVAGIYPGSFKLEATCGNSTITINNTTYNFTGADVVTTINWTPPISWASQNTTGTSVSVILKLYVKWQGTTAFELRNSKTVSISIPTSVKPSTSMALSDTTGYLSKYGSYIKTKSKVKVQLTNTLSYNSPIASYNIKANGVTYTTNPATTDVLKTAGTNTITAYVTDKRGRSSSTVSQNITVLDYANPSVSFSVRRCDEDGTLNENGGYCKVTYSASVSSLSSKNSKALKLSYKVSSETTTTDVTLPMSGYSVTNQNYIFQALDDKSYNITLSATDDFITTTKSTVLSTAFTLMHFNQSGKGLAIGKLSEGDKFEVAMPAKFSGGINGLINCNGVGGTTNIIDSTTKDTVDNWKVLGNNVYWFNKTGCLIDQPSQYGFLMNFTISSDIHQLWFTQTNGSVYHRGGNVYGWSGTWKKIYDDTNMTSTAISKADFFESGANKVSDFYAYKIGNIVNIQRMYITGLSVANNSANFPTIGVTIKAGYRPKGGVATRLICSNNGGKNIDLGVIGSNGVLGINNTIGSTATTTYFENITYMI